MASDDDDREWRFSVADVSEDDPEETDDGTVFGPKPDEGAMEVLPGDPDAENALFFLLGVAVTVALVADLVGLL